MRIMQMWKESCSIFLPANLKLFFLLALKAAVDIYTIMLQYFWWIFALLMGYALYIFPQEGDISLVLYIFKYVIIFIACLATRPSVTQKNCAYFRNRFNVLPAIFLTFFLEFCGAFFIAIFKSIIKVKKNITFFHDILFPLMKVIVAGYILFYAVFFFSLSIIFLFFFLDSDKKYWNLLPSFQKSGLMVLYNYPLFALVEVVCFLLVMVFKKVVVFVLWSELLYIVIMILIPLRVSMLANIYIKKRHEQFDLYFKKL